MQILTKAAERVKYLGLDPFDEFARVGTYKMLTIRELSGDVMMIVTIFPLDDKEQQENLKKSLAERLPFSLL